MVVLLALLARLSGLPQLTPLSDLCNYLLMRPNADSQGLFLGTSKETNPGALCYPCGLIFQPSMGKHHDKTVFSHGINKGYAGSKLNPKAHRLGKVFLSSYFNKVMWLSEPVTVARVMCCPGQFCFGKPHPWRCESDQLLLRYLPVSSTHLSFNHIPIISLRPFWHVPGHFLKFPN